MGTTEQPNPPSERRALLEAVIASTVGTTIEWYDFFLYGTAAALVFPRLFFPEFDPFVSQILSFGTFTVGFVARPLGGVFFGHLGDRIGRKSTLVATLLLMGLSTVLIGLLPTYDRIGVAAPLLLTALRFLQGFGVGGEWGGAVLLALEYSHRGRRGFFASWPQTGVPLGLLLSTAVMAGLEGTLSQEAFLAWGWRVPFLVSAVLILVGFIIRTRVLETPLFRQLQQSKQLAQAPLRETLARHWREVLLAAGARIGENASFYLFTAYVITYAREELGLKTGPVLRAIEWAAALEFLAIPMFGLLSDYWSAPGYVPGWLSLPDAVRLSLFRAAGERSTGSGADGCDPVPGRRPCDPGQRAGISDPRTVRHPAALHGGLARLPVGCPARGRPGSLDRGLAGEGLSGAVRAAGPVSGAHRRDFPGVGILPDRDFAQGPHD